MDMACLLLDFQPYKYRVCFFFVSLQDEGGALRALRTSLTRYQARFIYSLNAQEAPRLKKLLLILLLLFGFGMSTEYYSQSGGKKREKYPRKGKRRGNFILNQYKSRGHADEFARGAGRQGRVAKLFGSRNKGWEYKSAGSRRSQYKANRFLFTRYRSNGKKENDMFLDRQNSYRSKHRVRGSNSFKHRRYNRG